jgi:hypothetical protein
LAVIASQVPHFGSTGADFKQYQWIRAPEPLSIGPPIWASYIAIDPNPRGDGKSIGGADHDDRNDWLGQNTAAALPIDQRDEATAVKATVALYSGMIDLKPTDPIEGILISQVMVAHQASLSMYRRAWAQPPEFLEARLRYLSAADKAARTAMMLTERLDNHRNKGKQQIVVQHTTTVNANQAVVTDSVVT